MAVEKEKDRMALQAHLAEFNKLYDDFLQSSAWRDRLLLVSVTISGALFSFALTTNSTGGILGPPHALHILGPIVFTFAALWLRSSLSIDRIKCYMRKELIPKMHSFLPEGKDSSEGAVQCYFDYTEKEGNRILVRSIWVIVKFVCFFGPIAVAQLLLYFSYGSGLMAGWSLAFFILNCVLALLTLLIVFWRFRPCP